MDLLIFRALALPEDGHTPPIQTPLAGPRLHLAQQRGRHIRVVHEVDPAEPRALELPGLDIAMIDDARDAADRLNY